MIMDKRIVLIALVGLIVLNSSCTNKTISHNQRQQNDSLTVQENDDSLEKSDSLFDGDPNVSGSTRLIGAIMKSIADGDANTLASLTIYPIERRYPLHNIKCTTIRKPFKNTLEITVDFRMYVCLTFGAKRSLEGHR